MCIPCGQGDHERCEAKHGAIGPCNCPTCWPGGQTEAESDSDYAQRLLAEHGWDDRGYFETAVQMALESAEPAPRPVDVKDKRGRI